MDTRWAVLKRVGNLTVPGEATPSMGAGFADAVWRRPKAVGGWTGQWENILTAARPMARVESGVAQSLVFQMRETESVDGSSNKTLEPTPVGVSLVVLSRGSGVAQLGR